ncbi:VapC toxin family PIN domain ribonuclease [Haemophilus paracuniculus]|uniref:VapC toxin family PIN domain ribonuclease n=1 Tax=Haemophilus paracuniculus TaxID=734 RepID=A0A1T0ASB1_9PAST|nr:type II toxin-antitoxin system VapC family toxin [Haemophilus paracuniculus]OOR99029.1 VapC toxin family PIN domain ribonuclease [Haemophilus paracuniculus]
MKYLLDTNILAELRKFDKGLIDPNVQKWLAQIPPSQTCISVISLMEVKIGWLLKMRKDPTQGKMLEDWYQKTLILLYQDRTLPVTSEIALLCAELHIPNKRSYNDALIAATAMAHNLTLVTRNTKDFQGLKIKLLNPFEFPTLIQ